jgi:hypothetical protein
LNVGGRARHCDKLDRNAVNAHHNLDTTTIKVAAFTRHIAARTVRGRRIHASTGSL